MLNILGYKSEEYKKLVSNDFVKQLYISTEPIPLSDPPKVNYLWGERAHIEFTKLEILDFASKVWTRLFPFVFSIHFDSFLVNKLV